MENTTDEKKDFNKIPDVADEKFWQDFGGELWRMLKQDEAAAKSVAPIIESPPATAKHLPFARLNELAQNTAKPTAAETKHLTDCRYCERRLHKLSELTPVPPIEIAPAGSDLSPVVSKPERDFWKKARDFFHLNNLTATRQTVISASVIGGLIMTGAIFWTIFRQSPVTERTAVGTVDNSAADKDRKNSATNANRQILGSETNVELFDKTSPNNLTPRPAEPEKAANETGSANELEGVPPSERKAVVAALRSEPVPLSNELELFRAAPIVRGANDSTNSHKTPRQLNPVSRAVRDSSPVLNWQALENVEYFIVITDRAKREVVKSGALKQNSWRVSKPLPPGFYFWTVTAKNADGAEIASDARPAFFKVLAGTEKESLANTSRRVRSNLAKAVIYFRAGLFDEAERDALLELKQKPDSRPAQNLLRRIREFKKQNSNQ